jgi:hypothetical protein
MNKFTPHPQMHRCFNSAQTQVTDLDDCNCCTVTATAYALNILWDEAQALLKRMGRKRFKGFSTWKIAGHNLVKPYGEIREAKWLYNESGAYAGSRAGMTIKTFLRKCDPSKRYLVTVSGHALAVVDGKLCDYSSNLNRRVRYAFEVNPHLQRPGAINLPVCVNKNLTSAVACEKV